MIAIKFEMFRGLSNVEMAKILGKLDKRHLAPGDVLFQQGDEGDSMFFIDQGEMEMFAVGPDGNRHLLAKLTEGETFGEMALLTGEPRSATAIAAKACILYVVDMDTFQRVTEENASISQYMIRLLSRRLIQTNDRLQASKETKASWVVQDLEEFSPDVAKCLLYCSVLPVVSKSLVQAAFGLGSLAECMEKSPKLAGYIRMDADHGHFVLQPHVRHTLAELFVQRYGYAERTAWIHRAAAQFLAEGKPALAISAFQEAGEWEAVLDIFTENLQSEHMGAGLFELLDHCPDEHLFRRVPVFVRYMKDGLSRKRLEGFSRLETALQQRTLYFSRQESAELYEIAAEFCHVLDFKQKALEYLQLAEYLASTLHLEQTVPREDEDRLYRLAKQKLDSQKSVEMAASKSRFWKKRSPAAALTVLAAMIIMAFFHFAPPFAGLSREGMDFIGVGIAAVVFWIVNIIPDYIVALIMAMLWTVGGMVPPEVALSGFATPTWLYLLFILAMGAVITKSGLLYRLSLHALRRFPTSYRGQIWGIVAGGIVLNPLIPSSSAKVALGVPIAHTLSDAMGFPDRGKGAAGLGLVAMIFYGFTAPFVLTGSYTNVMAYGLVSGAEPLSWFQWFWYALPAFLIFTVGMLVLLSVFFSSKAASRPISQEVLDDQLAVLGKWTKDERITLTTVLGSILLLMLQPLHGLDNAWIMLLAFSVFVISGVLDAKTLRSGIDWMFLLFIGIAFSFAEAAQQLGIVDAMSAVLGDSMQSFLSSPALFLLCVILLSFGVTFIVRDDPAVILLVISMMPLAQKAGIHPWIMVFVILLATDPFFFSYQSPTYLTAYYSTEGKSFSHRQGQIVALCYGAVVLLAVLLSIPYWKWLGLISPP